MKIKTILLVLVLSFLTAWADDSKPAIDIKDKEGKLIAYSLYMFKTEELIMKEIRKKGTDLEVKNRNIIDHVETTALMLLLDKTKADILDIRAVIIQGNKENWDYEALRLAYNALKNNKTNK